MLLDNDPMLLNNDPMLLGNELSWPQLTFSTTILESVCVWAMPNEKELCTLGKKEIDHAWAWLDGGCRRGFAKMPQMWASMLLIYELDC